jgi:hypothetical protein
MDADDDLLAEIGRALDHAGTKGSDPRRAADAAWSWRDVDADLAVLTYDSWEDDASLVRGTAATERVLVFQGDGLSVEVERDGDGLVGQLVPPTAGEVTVLAPGGERARTTADDLGCFWVAVESRGPVRLRCRTADHDLLTEWVRV